MATFLGIVVLAFGPSYSYALIRILYGQNWSDGEASLALRYYFFYVISLAMNGLFVILTVMVFKITITKFLFVP
jgi:oligosaccharide translocation protein RFT1